MTLYTERFDAHLIVPMDCTLFFCARNKCKLADLGKYGDTDINLSAAQKFLSEVTGLSARNLDHGVCVTKLRTINKCKQP
jgi:hypothetical protein